jgi:L-2,4-diaminobutyrate decarboxylase
LMNQSSNVRQRFPSEDGNERERASFLELITQIVEGVDSLKNPEGVNLRGSKSRDGGFYKDLVENSVIPQHSIPMKEVNHRLLELLHAHPYHTKYFLTNILPMASIPGIIGMLTSIMINGNNLWDVYGPAGAEAEVKTVSMMSKLIGYDPHISGGYSTWGGQGAVFNGLRLAIAKFAPNANSEGAPQHCYAFCSEAAHYSLYKSMEATGLGSERLIRVRTHADSSMDLEDLEHKMREVLISGGIPIYIVGTTGTTDAMGIDDIQGIRQVATTVAEQYAVRRAHIHADSALGGFFAFFNDYDFASNALAFSKELIHSLTAIQNRIKHLNLADSLCFDFQKLGQAPYVTSLFMVKDAADLRLVDLNPDETPYVGHREYGQYHTSYTLECSRMASSISMYSALLAFGVEGYQRLLAQFVEVNHAIRAALIREIPDVEIVNSVNAGISTLFRIYPYGAKKFRDEYEGRCSIDEIMRTNQWNEKLFGLLGEDRDRMFFGDTKKHLLVSTIEGVTMPLYASKVFVISPYTELTHVEEIVRFLKEKVEQVLYTSNGVGSGGSAVVNS